MRRLSLSALACLACLGMPALAQGSAAPEYAIKSALLFKLPQFVYRSNAGADQRQMLCLLGSNPFGKALEMLAKKSSGEKEIGYRWIANPTEAGSCDFIFISRSEANNLDGILKRLDGRASVTVSDIDGFARAGGMVEMAIGEEGSPVSIVINRKAAQKQNIEFNAQLLRLAKVIGP